MLQAGLCTLALNLKTGEFFPTAAQTASTIGCTFNVLLPTLDIHLHSCQRGKMTRSSELAVSGCLTLFAPSSHLSSLECSTTPSLASPLSMRSVSEDVRSRTACVADRLARRCLGHQVGFEAHRDLQWSSPARSVSAGRIRLQLAPALPEQRELRDVGRLLALRIHMLAGHPSALRRNALASHPTRPLAHPLGTIWRLHRSSHLDVKLLRAVSTACELLRGGGACIATARLGSSCGWGF